MVSRQCFWKLSLLDWDSHTSLFVTSKLQVFLCIFYYVKSQVGFFFPDKSTCLVQKMETQSGQVAQASLQLSDVWDVGSEGAVGGWIPRGDFPLVWPWAYQCCSCLLSVRLEIISYFFEALLKLNVLTAVKSPYVTQTCLTFWSITFCPSSLNMYIYICKNIYSGKHKWINKTEVFSLF